MIGKILTGICIIAIAVAYITMVVLFIKAFYIPVIIGLSIAFVYLFFREVFNIIKNDGRL